MLKKIKKCYFFKKNARIRDVEILKKKFITSRNYTVTYHQALEEAPWLLRLDKPKNRQKFSKTFKKFFQKIAKIRKVAMLKPFYYP